MFKISVIRNGKEIDNLRIFDGFDSWIRNIVEEYGEDVEIVVKKKHIGLDN